MTTEKQAPAVDVIPEDGMQRWQLALMGETTLATLREELAGLADVLEAAQAYRGEIVVSLQESLAGGEFVVVVQACYPTAASFGAGLVLGALRAAGYRVQCTTVDFWPEVCEDARQAVLACEGMRVRNSCRIS